MWLKTLQMRFEQAEPRRRLPWFLGALVLFGLLLLPAVIYLGGMLMLGGFEGASLLGQYGSLYRGLVHASPAAWLVVLGPAMLLLLWHGLVAWWRRAGDLAAR